MQDGAVIGFHGGVCWKEIMNSEQTRKKATKKKKRWNLLHIKLPMIFLEPH